MYVFLCSRETPERQENVCLLLSASNGCGQTGGYPLVTEPVSEGRVHGRDEPRGEHPGHGGALLWLHGL